MKNMITPTIIVGNTRAANCGLSIPQHSDVPNVKSINSRIIVGIVTSFRIFLESFKINNVAAVAGITNAQGKNAHPTHTQNGSNDNRSDKIIPIALGPTQVKELMNF